MGQKTASLAVDSYFIDDVRSVVSRYVAFRCIHVKQASTFIYAHTLFQLNLKFIQKQNGSTARVSLGQFRQISYFKEQI